GAVYARALTKTNDMTPVAQTSKPDAAGIKEQVRTMLAGWLAPVPDDNSPVAVAPAMGIRAVFRRLWPYARPHRGGVASC
ncbi:MAG: hypothetical protein M3325_15965, partial [Actinomycetota bacterium]|nr:hypothetical protein [Actinomycetota bacterium]